MSTAHEEIARLRKESGERAAEIDRLERMAAAYPDLRRYEGRWKKVVFCSKAVNAVVSSYDMRHNCGCCSDSPLELWPYAETDVGRVYSDPPMFFIGERSWMGGDDPKPGWKDELRKAGIPETIIDRVKAHFRQEREDRIAAASAGGDDEDDNED